jgi:hypothetical protein
VLEQPRKLTALDRDTIHLGFGMWLARMAWQMRVDAETIRAILAGHEPASDAAPRPAPSEDVAPTSPSTNPEAKATTGNAANSSASAEREPEDGTSEGTAGRVSQVGGAEPRASAATSDLMDATSPGGEQPGTHSPAMAPKSEEGRTTGKSTRAKAFVAPPGEDHERTVKREEVAALNEAEPWLSPDEAAARLRMPVVNLRIFSTELEITWSHPRRQAAAPAPAPVEVPRTVQQKVTAMHRMHPTWTARLIAQAIGAPLATVSSYLTVARRTVAEEQARAA